jgi:hypothetical protein
VPDDPLATVAGFLRGIGIPVAAGPVDDGAFLPGIHVVDGGLRVDEARLSWPGDLLHEAGHLAVAPPEARLAMSGDVAAAGLDTAQLEIAVVPWSYAAALACGIDPALVFHAGGYRGKGEGLLRTFAAGVFPGVHLLEAAGMTATGPRAAALGVAPYPHMRCWLRPAD